jgi:hypothetical protein
MTKTRRPRMTRQVLEGLTQAHGRMEADDLTDLPDNEAAALEAAGKWLNEMWQFFPDYEPEVEDDGSPPTATTDQF